LRQKNNPWFAVDQIVFSLPLSVIVIVVVSLVTGKKQSTSKQNPNNGLTV
jgi:hypothetical protein